MFLLDLPNELLLSVADTLRCENSINALARTNRQLYCLLDAFLHEYHIKTTNHSGLLWAAYHGLTNTLLKFLDLGANIQATNNKGATALHLASQNGHLLIVEMLIQSGTEIDAQTLLGVTPLHRAVRAGHEHITRVLLENGADIMKSLPTGPLPNILHVASYFGFTDIVQLLLDKGIGIEVKDKNLQTPLHYAVNFDEKHETWHGNITTVVFLLEKKAVKDSWDRSGQRPKDLAMRNPNSIIKLLLQSTTNSTLNEAILLDQAIQQKRRRKKEREEERTRKAHELAAERAAKLKAREAEKQAKEELLRKTKESAEYLTQGERARHDNIRRDEEQSIMRERWAKLRIAADDTRLRRDMDESRKQQSRIDELKPASTEHQKMQNTVRESWVNLRAEAEGQRQVASWKKRQSCSHSALDLLRWKGKGQCDICDVTFMKHLFRCADCGFVACRQCKTAS